MNLCPVTFPTRSDGRPRIGAQPKTLVNKMLKKVEDFLVDFLREFVRSCGRACYRTKLTWRGSAQMQEWFREARGQGQALSQHRKHQDGGVLHSLYEKMPPWWTHVGMMVTVTSGVIDALKSGRHYEATMQLAEVAVKNSLLFVTLTSLDLSAIVFK